jgi:hypothetical protein
MTTVSDPTPSAPRLLTLYDLRQQMALRFTLAVVVVVILIVLPLGNATESSALGLGAAGVMLVLWWLVSLRYCHPLLEMRFERACRAGMFGGPTDHGRSFREAWTEANGDPVAFRALLAEAEGLKNHPRG